MQIEPLGVLESIEQMFVNISNLPQAFWLDSALETEKLGRFSYIGALPVAFIKATQEGVSLWVEGREETCSQEPIEALCALMARYKIKEKGPFPFCGGAVGYLSYDLKKVIEKLPDTAIDDLQLPLLQFAIYDFIVAYDHQSNEAFFIGHEMRADSQGIKTLFLSALKKIKHLPVHYPKPHVFYSDQTKAEYLESVESVRNYIRSGDIYQANYTQRISCDFRGSGLGLYLELRKVNPAPFAAYLPYEDFEILSSSPERFIQKKEERIETRPIKGTVKRGKTEKEDFENREWLLSSEKDRSELLMIVDLERNDLSRISKVGTVRVTELFALEKYATVYHLVSTVEGKCRPDISIGDIIRCTFPGGSITGAPKIKAMEVIDTLEVHSRGLYTGSIGYIGFDGDMDLSIVIRTLVYHKDKLHFGIGGGIVWDSIPESEYEESLTKGKALMQAICGGDNYVLEQC